MPCKNANTLKPVNYNLQSLNEAMKVSLSTVGYGSPVDATSMCTIEDL